MARVPLALILAAAALAGCRGALTSPFRSAGPTTTPAVSHLPLATAAPPVAGDLSPTPVLELTVQPVPSAPARAGLVATSTVQPVAPPPPLPTARPITQTENILLLGTDTRSNFTVWNTDSIIVLAIDRDAGQAGVISIPRDLWVDIPGYGENRINTADYLGEKMGYPGGGPALARRTLELATGIPTQHYVTFQQDGLIKLVDALGGVTVNLDCPLYEMVPDPQKPDAFLTLELPAGPVLLDGATAKKFVTYRYVESDWGRQRRQQQLVWALRNRVVQGDVLPHIPQLLQALRGMFTTDLSLPEIVSLAAFAAQLKPGDVHAANAGPELYEEYTTELGAWVLLLKDRAVLQERVAQLFSAPTLTEAGEPTEDACPPAPPGFVDLSPLATPAP